MAATVSLHSICHAASLIIQLDEESGNGSEILTAQQVVTQTTHTPSYNIPALLSTCQQYDTIMDRLPPFSVHLLIGCCTPQDQVTHCVPIANLRGPCYLAEAIELLLDLDEPWPTILQDRSGVSVGVPRNFPPCIAESPAFSSDQIVQLGSLQQVLEGVQGRTILSPVSSVEDAVLQELLPRHNIEGEGLFYCIYFTAEVRPHHNAPILPISQ
jgi:hypothetical protein